MPYDDIRFSGWDDDEPEEMPQMPIGGYYQPCCPDWNTKHVAPVIVKGVVVCWQCSHCETPHYTNYSGDKWDDNIPF